MGAVGEISRACQHCYGRLSWTPSEDPSRGDRLVDHRGEFECAPGLEHKLMPEVR